MVFPVVGGTQSTGYEIENSLRFNDGDSPYLNRTFATPTNRKKFTFSAWFKRSTLSTNQYIISYDSGGLSMGIIGFYSSDKFTFYDRDASSGAADIDYTTNQLFRDISAWYHIVVSVDTTDGTSGDRVKIYVNGTRITSFDTSTTPAQNYDTIMNSAVSHDIGRWQAGSNYYDGYMSEINFIDGQALAPTEFGETNDNGVWIPKEYSGTYGTNGFFLPFDNKGKIHTISVVGNTHHETDQAKFGATSIYFDGSGDELEVNDIGQFTFEGDFTVEFFARMGDQADTYATIINDVSGGSPVAKFRVNLGNSSNSTPNLTFYSSTFDAHVQGTTDLSDNAWHHCAVVRDNGTIRIFVDGTQETTRADSGNLIDVSGVLEFGTYSGSKAYTGYLDEIRISNIARYTSNFTPPTAIFSDDEHTRLLIHSDSTDGNTTFTDSSGVAGGIGNDSSGNNNDFASTNINTQIDQTTDTPTNNFCTLNPLDSKSGDTYSEGNTAISTVSSGDSPSRSTFSLTNGKWYWEVKRTSAGSPDLSIGVMEQSEAFNNLIGSTAKGYGYYSANGNKYNNDSNSSYGNSFGDGDIIGIALDMDNGVIWFSKNGTWQNSATQAEIEAGTTTNSAFTGISGTISPAISDGGTGSSTAQFNFGNPPFSISSGNADANGYGNFEYAVPSGYYALCTKNLAEYG